MSSHSRPEGASSSSHAPRTTSSRDDQPDTVPTVSATGVPRIIPRYRDERDSEDQDEKDKQEGSAPSEIDFSDDSEQDKGLHYQPSGSLTLAALSPSSALPMQRRLALLASSIFINLGLPFLNGVMLGFGEIFARVVLAPVLGITNVGWSGDTSRANVRSPFARGRTSSATTQASSWEWAQGQQASRRKEQLAHQGAGSPGAVDTAHLSPDVAYHPQE